MNTSPSPMAGPRAHDHAPEVGSWVQGFLAFLLHLAGLLGQPGTKANQQLAQALRELEDLIAAHARGELSPPSRRPSPAPTGQRLPRAQRRILLTPGLYAALYFTPRAAIAARARIASRAGGVHAALLATSRTAFSFSSLQAALPNRALIVTI